MSALKDLEPGDSVSVTILREGEQLTLSVELEGR
jgi:S1-C subfamily serine protease